MGRRITATAVLLVVVATIGVTAALATPAAGLVANLFARGTFTTPVNANADGVKLRTHGSTDHAVQEVNFTAGSTSGWHRHPGVVLVTLKSGTLVRYHSDCSRETFTAGQSFFESGTHAALVRNESHHDTIVYVSYILPTGAPLRIDMPNPGCAVQ
jgi:hypothetical protein